MPGVGLVHRKKVVVFQCRHILCVNQYDHGGHQHQHHRQHRSIHRHCDKKKRTYRPRKFRRATDDAPFDHIFTSREDRRFEIASSKLSSARSGKFESRGGVRAASSRISLRKINPRHEVERKIVSGTRDGSRSYDARISFAFLNRSDAKLTFEGCVLDACADRTNCHNYCARRTACERVHRSRVRNSGSPKLRESFSFRPVPTISRTFEGLSVSGHRTVVDCHSRTRNRTRFTDTKMQTISRGRACYCFKRSVRLPHKSMPHC